MNGFETVLSVCWGIVSLASLLVVIYRTPLAHWLRPQMRFWRHRPNSQRLYERTMLLGGIGLGTFSLIALYVAMVVMPRLDRALAQIRSTTKVPRQTASAPAI